MKKILKENIVIVYFLILLTLFLICKHIALQNTDKGNYIPPQNIQLHDSSDFWPYFM